LRDWRSAIVWQRIRIFLAKRKQREAVVDLSACAEQLEVQVLVPHPKEEKNTPLWGSETAPIDFFGIRSHLFVKRFSRTILL
jgi:hypothetical protein